MNKDFAKRSQESVHHFYEKHGESFSATRKSLWPEQILIAKRISSGQTVIDVGAGNGRFRTILPDDIQYIGIEPSKALRKTALKSTVLQSGELPKLKIKDKIANVTVCFAAFHHLPTEKIRAQSVEELIRITKPGNLIVATAWYIPKDKYEPVEESSEDDVWISWKADNEEGRRFVHRFNEKEWRRLWTHPELDIENIGLFGDHDWTKDTSNARNFMVIATRKTS
jgi:SAM-dependent methyltransferase